ncbi:MAG: C40 family peptidase [Melioribacteraceae bacterium]|nr:C40 family peptidase [Melioribacteraceae bacterium]
MVREFFNKIIFSFLLFLIFTFAGCSSSSYSSRFKKPPPEKESVKDNSVRFSSENDDSTYAEFDEMPPEESDVENEILLQKFSNPTIATISNPKEKLLFDVLKFVNTPYQFGGESKSGADCSGFTQTLFKESLNVELPRTASLQYQVGNVINDQLNLEFGDLVFFNTTRRSFPGHVGVYLGDDLFAHSSVSKGVTISNIQSNYYKSRYVGARRINNFVK